MLKANAFPCQCVNMRRLIVPASIATKTLPAGVIRHDENEVGRTLCRSGRNRRASERGNEWRKKKKHRGDSRRWPTLENANAAATARFRFENHKKHPLFMQTSRPKRKVNLRRMQRNSRWKKSKPANAAPNPPRNPRPPPQRQPSPNRSTALSRLHLRRNRKTLGIQIKGQSERSRPKNPSKQSLPKSLIGVDHQQKQPKQRQNLRKNAGKRKKVHFSSNKTAPFCY